LLFLSLPITRLLLAIPNREWQLGIEFQTTGNIPSPCLSGVSIIGNHGTSHTSLSPSNLPKDDEGVDSRTGA